MDWIDNLWNKLKNRINNLSLKKALIIYIIISIGIIGLLIAITQKACNEWTSAIMSKYYEGYKLGVIGEAQTYIKIYDYSNFNKADRTQLEIIYFIQTWSTVIYSLAGIIGVSYLYYNNKLKEPIRLLSEVADEVGRYNLDIEICYEKGDEMGRLCRAFDSMRRQLIANNQKMWDMMEEQRRINAAFAHDLRTPLTILRGYTDLLSKYIPEGKITEEKLLSTVKLMSDHIGRLENYSNTMKQINSLDELAVRKRPVEGIYFIEP